MSCRTRSFLFVLIATAATLPGSAAGAEKRPRSVLEDVPALEKRVTYTETKIPLGELVQKVAVDTGVKLTAAKDVADEPVAVVVKDFPARELLQELAELLDYQWSRRRGDGGTGRPGDAEKRDPARDDWLNTQHPTLNTQHPPSTLNAQHSTLAPQARFEIWQDLASKQREEALRQASLAGVERRFQEEVARHVEMAALPGEEIQRLKTEGERRMEESRKLPREERLALVNRPGERERGMRYGLAMRLSSPVTRGMALLLGRLSPAQWALLRGGETLTFATDPQRGELALPAELARDFRAARPSMDSGMRYGNPEITERERQREAAEAERWTAATGYRVTLQMNPPEIHAANALFLSARAQPVRSGAPREFSHFQGGEGTRLLISASPGSLHDGLPQDSAKDDPKIVHDPVFGSARPFQPKPQPPPNHFGVRPRFAGRMLRDLLPEIGQAYGVQIIADAYRSTPRVSTGLPPQPVSLYALLDRLATSTYHWERQGNVARIRSRTWFFERPREIPLRFVRQWKQSCDRYGLLSLEEWVQAASVLTDLQMDWSNLSAVASEADLSMNFSPHVLEGPGPALRLYGALSPTQRQALWQGQAVPVAQMTPQQRALFVEAVRRSRRDRPELFSLERLGSGSLAMTRSDYICIVRPEGTGRRARTEPVSPPGDTPAGSLGQPLPLKERVTTKDGVTRYGMTVLLLQFQAGPESLGQAQFNVRTPP